VTPQPPLHACRLYDDGGCETFGDPDLMFPWWSVTKTAIAICAFRLAEQGRLDLDALLPGQPFTLHQLLTHRAGLPDYAGLRAYHAAVRADEAPWPRDALVETALAQGRLFAPGQGWRYSNVGYLLARERIEAVAGQGLGALVDAQIAGPLGLDSVMLAQTRSEFARVAWPAARRYHPGWVYHGCLIGTAPDAAQMMQALFAGRLLRAESLSRMRETLRLGGALPGRPWTEHGYATGLMSGRAGTAGRAIGHSGAGPFSVNAVYHFPDLPRPVTVASFNDGHDEGVAEREAVRLALSG
jgi:CubicO group peptidase (beta-lactamase class C family)